MYTEVQWLSKGKCFEHLFNLQKEVTSFLKNTGIFVEDVFALEQKLLY